MYAMCILAVSNSFYENI